MNRFFPDLYRTLSRILTAAVVAAVVITTSSMTAFAQKTTIRGMAPGAEKKLISMTRPGDLVTFFEKPLATARIDSTGAFLLAAGIDQTTNVTLAIGFHKAEMLLEPGKSYSVSIAPLPYDQYTEVNPFIQSQNLTLTIEGNDPLELNMLTGQYNAFYSAFLMEHFNALYKERRKILLDTFRLQADRRFGKATNPYFLDYTAYKVASLEQLTQYYSKAELARRYFLERPILYNNLEYMEFFNSYFARYAIATSATLRKLDMASLLAAPDPYKAIMKAYTADTLLKSEQLRELVMLKGMMEIFGTPAGRDEDILRVITQARDASKFDGNREVAGNLVSLLTRLRQGTAAPGFTLVDKDQKPHTLEEYRGKPVLLTFWTTYCEGCLAEMDLIRPLYDKYRENIHFVSISADKYLIKMIYFINMKKDYVWNFLNIGEQAGVLVDYDVRSYPLFVLVDKDGKIFRYPASLPSEGLEAEIQSMLEKQ